MYHASSPLRRAPAVFTLLALLLALLTLGGCSLLPGDGSPSGTPAPVASLATQPPASPVEGDLTTNGMADEEAEPRLPLASATAGAAPAAPTTAGATISVSSAITPFVICGGGKTATGWSDASWGGAKSDLAATGSERDGKPTIEVTFTDGWQAWSVADWNHQNTPNTTPYTHLRFWINGGQTGGQAVGVILYAQGAEAQRVRIDKYLPGGKVPAGRWQEVFIPIADLHAEGTTVDRVAFQESSGKAQEPFYLDGIALIKDLTPPPTPIVTQAQITIDVSANRSPISPYIYGMSNSPEDVAKAANITLNRMGGNPYSRYNWTLGNARNAGSDWEYRNYSREPDDPAYRKPSGLADMFFKGNRRVGAETILTVPMLGFVAKDDNNDSRSTNVPDAGGAPLSPGSLSIAGYDPTRNQQATSVRSLARKGSAFKDPPDPGAPAVYQDEWVNHLVNTFGRAGAGGVKFYAMDNEPDLWADNTHVDVHPTRPGYDDMARLFTEYARAVKAVDPTALVTGPVVSGWTGYWNSALDMGDDAFRTAADRKAHGGMPFLPWFLDTVRKQDEAAGARTLDVLDIHYYPQGQGIWQDRTDPNTSALRLRSTRSLWDPTYTDESWIARTEQSNVMLIPRMKEWIDRYYPGTRLGITEWKWSAETTMNGALAIAEVLGIYGREGVYLACYWTNPPLGSAGLEAFKLYRNYDGSNSTFGDVSVLARSSDTDKLSVFASEDTAGGKLKIIVLNKSPKETMSTSVQIKGAALRGSAQVYRLSEQTGLKIQRAADAPLQGGAFSLNFPPYSASLLVIDKAP